ncbi:MAG: hypothetical protein ABEK50_17770 [bacterium]
MEERSWFNLINFNIQFRLMFILISAILFNTLLMGGFIWYCLSLMFEDVSLGAIIQGISPQMMSYGVVTTVAVLVAGGLFCVVLFRETHRIVGPIYRIKEELKTIHETGSVKPISVRSDDHFQELVKELNLVLLDLSNSSDSGQQ